MFPARIRSATARVTSLGSTPARWPAHEKRPGPVTSTRSGTAMNEVSSNRLRRMFRACGGPVGRASGLRGQPIEIHIGPPGAQHPFISRGCRGRSDARGLDKQLDLAATLRGKGAGENERQKKPSDQPRWKSSAALSDFVLLRFIHEVSCLLASNQVLAARRFIVPASPE